MTLERHREPCHQPHKGPEAEELPLEPCSPSWGPSQPYGTQSQVLPSERGPHRKRKQ